MSGSCRACGEAGPWPFFTQAGIPVNSCLLLDDRAQALAFPKGDLELAFCRSCGFIQNERFAAERVTYSAAYEETQAFSPRFMRFVDELIDDLDNRLGLAGKTVLEIGCGKGDFLARLVERTGAHGIGIDPSWRAERMAEPGAGSLRFIADYYGPAHAELAADLVVCRHTLEHLPDVQAFLQQLRASIGDRTATQVLFELPDTARVLAERALWDIYYEHCSYFTAGSLARLFRRAGFAVKALRTVYDGQYLLLEATPTPTPTPTSAVPDQPLEGEETPAELLLQVEAFAAEVPARLAALRRQLDAWQAGGARVVLWGSGSKAVAYLTSLDVGPEVLAVIDINPHKTGKYLAGTGHKIESPDRLPALRPDVVLVMNPVYRAEIAQSLAAIGLAPALHSLD